MIRIPVRRTRRGITFVELLVAALLMSIGVMGLVGTWAFSYRVTEKTDSVGMSYNVGRMVLEQYKLMGFSAPEGPAAFYYNGDGQGVSSTSSDRRYRVDVQITSDVVNSGTAGQSGAVPNQYALRDLTVNVIYLPSGETLWQTHTRMVKAGI